MNTIERAIQTIKNGMGLTSGSRAVGAVRPFYNLILDTVYGKNGLERVINGQEKVHVLTRQRNLPETYEPAVYDFITRSLQPGWTMFDVGSHIGLMSIIGSRRVGPEGRVFAFEPTPATRDVLKEHFAMNGVTNATIVPKAVSDKCGTTEFYACADSCENTLSNTHSRLPGARATQVEITTIDAFCEENNVVPNLIKLDVEGFEIHALRGAKKTIAQHHPILVVEMHPMNWPEIGVTRDEAQAMFDELGLKPVAMEGQTDVFGPHGHIRLEPLSA